jgi:hypothetical protein
VVLDEHRPETAGVDVSGLPARLTDLLPQGIDVEQAAPVDRRADSLQQQVTSCSWTMRVGGVSRRQLEEQVESLLAAPTVLIVRERKGRQERDDLRPSVLALAVSDDPAPGSGHVGPGRPSSVGVVAELATQPRGVRPVELVRGLVAVSGPLPEGRSAGVTLDAGSNVGTPVLDRACRTQQWIERDGARQEPLQRRGNPAGAERAVHALERAS